MSNKKSVQFNSQEVRLVQRLLKPNKFTSPDSWAFGSGNSNLTREQREAIKDVFSFDYMGNGEFEFGEPKSALNSIAHYANRDKANFGNLQLPQNGSDIFYVCHRGGEDSVQRLIERFSYDDESGLAEPLYFKNALKLDNNELMSYPGDLGGWLICDSKIMPSAFFIDEKMFEGFKGLFQK